MTLTTLSAEPLDPIVTGLSRAQKRRLYRRPIADGQIVGKKRKSTRESGIAGGAPELYFGPRKLRVAEQRVGSVLRFAHSRNREMTAG